MNCCNSVKAGHPGKTNMANPEPTQLIPDAQWPNKRVTVMGLGRFGGGVGVTHWLAGKGARVTVSDLAPPEELAESVAALEGLGVVLRLGGHEPADLVDCDVLVVNPAVPFDSPHLAAAREAGVQITTEINLFLARCRAPVIGITGSAGKSTTTAMIGAVLARRGKSWRIWRPITWSPWSCPAFN